MGFALSRNRAAVPGADAYTGAAVRDPTPAPTPTTARPGSLQAAAALSAALPPLNSVLLFVALVPIRDHFGVSTAYAAWLVTGYLIGSAAMQPVGGRLGDMFGRRRVFLIGLAYTAAASLLAMAAPTYELLLFFRINQAIAGGLIVPNVIASLRAHGPPERRGRSFGIVAASIGTGTGAGPVLSGIIIVLLDWRAIFAVSLPLVVVAGALALRGMPADRPEPGYGRGQLELWSPLLMVGAFGALMLSGGAFGRAGGTGYPAGAALVFGALALGGVFLWWQRRSASPLIRTEVFRRGSSYLPGSVSALLVSVCTYTGLVYLPIYVQDMHGDSERMAGLLLGVLALFTVGLAPLVGLVSDRIGRRPVATVGAVFFTIAMVMSNALGATTPWWYLILMMCVWGLGSVFLGAPTETASMESVPPRVAGSAAGTYSTLRYVGGIIGTTVLAGVVGAGGLTDPARLHVLTAVLTVAAAGTVLTSLKLHRWPPGSLAEQDAART